ncbi:carbamoyltransferase C-terminal domain-containing protein [Paenibacillus chitinolyticus]|uniref:carbamoyltransferase C-terminal domain-containing protein n=1 Tax=Paenibacillus chitinolyticus TaxID=79263 RepID=UPI003D05D0CB
MLILGLGGSIHDFSACLLHKGKIVCAIEEERLSRSKQAFVDASTFRCKAARYCLDYAGVTEKDVDLIIGADNIESRYYARYVPGIRLMNHHLAHAASAFYPSPFTEAAVLVADGRGSYLDRENKIVETVTYYAAGGGEIREIRKVAGRESDDFRNVSNSAGLFYLAVTEEIGFGPMYDEKTLAVSAYGTDRLVEPFRAFYSLDDEGGFSQTLGQMNELRSLIRAELGRSESGGELFRTKADAAYAVQVHLERILIHACRYLHKRTGSDNLCLAGSVFLNYAAVNRLLRETPFKRLYLPPAVGDAGAAVGSALYGHYVLGGHHRGALLPATPYLGKPYPAEAMEEAVCKAGDFLEEVKAEDVNGQAARLLSEGNLVAVFREGAEFGPKALGNRSILADAGFPGNISRLNSAKKREDFRPFDYILLEEDAGKGVPPQGERRFQAHAAGAYASGGLDDAECVGAGQADRPEPAYQTDPADPASRTNPAIPVTPVTPVNPASLTAEGTAQMHAISPGLNAEMAALLENYKRITGCPLLLNTSFNLDGEPMVETPAEAVRCFLKAELDVLLMGNKLYRRKKTEGEVQT